MTRDGGVVTGKLSRSEALLALKNASTSAEMLCRLLRDFAGDTEIPAQIAAHANLPVDLLRHLLRFFPEHVYRNPAAGPLLLKGELALVPVELRILKQELWHGLVPPYALRAYLAQDPNPHVRCAAARYAPLAWLQPFLDDPEPRLRAQIAARRDLPMTWYKRIARDSAERVRATLAANPQACHLLASNDPSPLVRRARFRDEFSVAQVAPLVLDPEPRVRARVAQWPGLTLSQMQTLSEDGSPKVRATLARRADLPCGVQCRLATFRDSATLFALAQNPALCREAAVLLINKGSSWVRMQMAGNEHLPPDIKGLLAEDREPMVRGRLAAQPQLPMTSLMWLANDADRDVRAAIARHSSLSTEFQRNLASDVDVSVREQLAGNPGLAAEAQALLVADVESRVRAQLSKHHALGAEHWLKLRADNDSVVEAHCENPALDREQALWLLEHRMPTSIAACRHPALRDDATVLARVLTNCRPLPPEWQGLRIMRTLDWLADACRSPAALKLIFDFVAGLNPSLRAPVAQRYLDYFERDLAVSTMRRLLRNPAAEDLDILSWSLHHDAYELAAELAMLWPQRDCLRLLRLAMQPFRYSYISPMIEQATPSVRDYLVDECVAGLRRNEPVVCEPNVLSQLAQSTLIVKAKPQHQAAILRGFLQYGATNSEMNLVFRCRAALRALDDVGV